MSFEQALEFLKRGGKVCREGWNGKGMSLQAQFPDENSANTLPYIFIITVTGDRVPWVASHSDLFANDWLQVAAGETHAN